MSVAICGVQHVENFRCTGLPRRLPEIVMSNQEDVLPMQLKGCGEVTSVGSCASAAHAAAGSETSPPAGPQSRWKTA